MLGKQKTGKLKPWFKEKGEGGRPFNRGKTPLQCSPSGWKKSLSDYHFRGYTRLSLWVACEKIKTNSSGPKAFFGLGITGQVDFVQDDVEGGVLCWISLTGPQ